MKRSTTRGRALRTTALCVAASMMLSACESMVPPPKSIDTPPLPSQEDAKPAPEDLVRFNKEPVITLRVPMDEMMPRVQGDPGEPLPDVRVGRVVVNQMPVTKLLRMLVEPHGLAVVPASDLSQTTVSIIDPEGGRSLSAMMDLVAKQAGLYWHHEDGVIYARQRQSHVVRVPSMPFEEGQEQQQDFQCSEGSQEDGIANGSLVTGLKADLEESFTNTFAALGAANINADGHSGILSFDADRKTYQRISTYLQEFAEGREILVYDTWIYEVQLDDNKSAGIEWGDLRLERGDFGIGLGRGTNSNSETGGGNEGGAQGATGAQDQGLAETALNAATGAASLSGPQGFALGLGMKAGNVALSSLLNFLSSQGDVRTLSKPQLTMSNGRKARFRVGRCELYVSKAVVENEDGGESSGDDVKGLALGTTLQVAGNHNNGVITTALNIGLQDLIRYQTFQTSSNPLRLPMTSERMLTTEIQSRPGDLIVLGGTLQDRSEYNGENFAAGDIPTNRASERSRTELVIMLRPRLIKIRPDGPFGKRAEIEANTPGPAQTAPKSPASVPEAAQETPGDPVILQPADGGEEDS